MNVDMEHVLSQTYANLFDHGAWGSGTESD